MSKNHGLLTVHYSRPDQAGIGVEIGAWKALKKRRKIKEGNSGG